jgi:diaminopimelate epimerase
MQFTKMHGAGNDYIYLDCFAQTAPADPSALARAMSDRHCGVGGDGLILVCPAADADAEMRMYNADGSYSENCGNALRCVAKLLYERGIARRESLEILTGGRIMSTRLHVDQGVVRRVEVDMGEPILQAAEIPTTLPGDPPLDVEFDIAGRHLRVCCVSMGNPHCVAFVDEPTDELVLGLGPLVERDPRFPRRVNVEFVQVLDRSTVRQRTWERGSGETLACGTGACAVAVAGALTGRTERRVTVRLLGGDLEIHWREDDNRLRMTGPAVEVFRGQWPAAEGA